jgi:hypothetical protein
LNSSPAIVKHRAKRRKAQSGYALLMLVFVAALMLVAASTIGLKVATQGQREREMELEWRGKQYARGVKLFSRKNGRFPKSIEELVKPGLGVRFMRKAYKDPLNTGDGTWRLIYVGPAGQLIGSTKAGSRIGLLPGAAGAGVRPAMAGATPAGAMSGPSDSSLNESMMGQRASKSGVAPAAKAASDDPFSAPSISTGLGSSGTVIGGNIIGVGSKVDKSSVRVYEGASTYREWEFIYDPSKDRTIVAQPGTQIGAPGIDRGPNANPRDPLRRGRRPLP